MAKKEFDAMTPKERRSALGGSKSAYVRRQKKHLEMKRREGNEN